MSGDDVRVASPHRGLQPRRPKRPVFDDVPDVRRRIMSSIRSKDTKPELAVRRTVHRMGYRYRLHRKGLPGRPDLVFPRLRKVIFVHGCFWHQHASPTCRASTRPVVRQSYWLRKLARNVERDAENLAALAALGWDAMVVWDCELQAFDSLVSRIATFLAPYGGSRARSGWASASVRALLSWRHPARSTKNRTPDTPAGSGGLTAGMAPTSYVLAEAVARARSNAQPSADCMSRPNVSATTVRSFRMRS